MSIYPSRSILYCPAIVSGTAWHRIGNRRIDGSVIAPCVAPGIPLRRPEPVVAPVRRRAIAVEAVITKFGHGPARLRSGTLASSSPAG
ncbi:hypothetical protein WJ15_37020 [Burkholderia cepacia]|uniref:hypothetical protein n=1 Tax=Burkholderia cepacia TaxID=292 RepID=UPI00076D712E|nr:hypothetical protein [Burkholderia cepacia]KVF54153.1 hypothetical protein WJ15_37020 [Burkholderia cepacia]